MADAFQKLKSSVNRGITTINVKTSSSLEKTKIRTHIDSLEAEIQKLLLSAGETAYSLWDGGGDDNTALTAIYETIRRKRGEVAELKTQLDSIDARDSQILGTMKQSETPAPATVCPACGAVYEAPVNFCKKCGQKMN